MKVLLAIPTAAQLESIDAARSASYIFHGAEGMGKAVSAYELVRKANCQGDQGGLCAACRQFAAGSYPDIITVRPEEKPSITIEQVRALVQTLSLSLYYPDGTRGVVIDNAHALTTEAQNALLKLIEEPPPQTLFILVTDRIDALLPTVRSRCEPIYFQKVPRSDIAAYLSREHSLKPSDAAALADASAGAPGVAVMLATDPEAATARLSLTRVATTITGRSLFERLLVAKQLADSKTDLIQFGQLLHSHILGLLRSDESLPGLAARQLAALELFRVQIAAKVAPRVALERLMLEL